MIQLTIRRLYTASEGAGTEVLPRTASPAEPLLPSPLLDLLVLAQGPRENTSPFRRSMIEVYESSFVEWNGYLPFSHAMRSD